MTRFDQATTDEVLNAMQRLEEARLPQRRANKAAKRPGSDAQQEVIIEEVVREVNRLRPTNGRCSKASVRRALDALHAQGKISRQRRYYGGLVWRLIGDARVLC